MPLHVIVIAVVIIVGCLFRPAGLSAAWQAGMARSTITPREPMWMSGYGGRDRPAEGKLTDLWAKVLVLQDEQGQRAILITLDLVGIDRMLSRELCGRIGKKHNVSRGQIALCTSHTHTGPVVGRNLAPLHYLQLNPAQQKQVDDYAEQLVSKIVSLVDQAIQGLAECSISWGSGTCDVAVNRRENSEAQVPQLRAAGRLMGPVDHDVPVLAVHDSRGGLQAVVFGYACHATVLSFYQWSGDYPGFAQLAVEKEHPGCQAMFWAGCGADQNPLPRRSVALAQTYGQHLAKSVEAVLSKPREQIEPNLKVGYREVPLALSKLPSREQLQRDAKSSQRFHAARAAMLLRMLDDGKNMSQTYPYPVGTWQLGRQVEFVTLGGEVVVDYALRIKRQRRGIRTWVAGYSNDVMAYIPTRRVLREGGYEGGGAMVYYGLPTIWAPSVEQSIVAEVVAQLATPASDSKPAKSSEPGTPSK